MENNYLWKVNYRTAFGESHVFVSADSSYSKERVAQILTEVHPEWKDLQPKRLESLPFPTRKPSRKIKL